MTQLENSNQLPISEKRFSLILYAFSILAVVTFAIATSHVCLEHDTWGNAITAGLRSGLALMIIMTAMISHSNITETGLRKSGEEEKRTALISEFQTKLKTVPKGGDRTSRQASLKEIKKWAKEMRIGLRAYQKAKLAAFFKPNRSLLIFVLSIPVAVLLDYLLYGLGFWAFLQGILGS